jgi:hypothetical protein
MIDGSNNTTAVNLNNGHNKYESPWTSDEDLSQLEHNEEHHSIRSFATNANTNTGWFANNVVSRWFFGGGSNQDTKKNQNDDRTYY